MTVKAQEHPHAPHNQPFNIQGKKNAKAKAWYKVSPYHNNRVQSRVESSSKVQRIPI